MKGIRTNIETYDFYYAKPPWWFRWRYDTQVKRKTCLALIKTLKAEWAYKKILEVGFGSGDVLFSFPKNCELYGIELSSSAVERASSLADKKGYRKFKFFTAQQPFYIPLDDHSIDLVVASHVLEHVESDVDCLKEVWRILKHKGSFAVLVPINERFKDKNHLRRYTSEGCRTICEGLGFTLLHEVENELLFYLVEQMYWRYRTRPWTLSANIARVLFNFITAPLPFWSYQLLDSIFKKVTKLPPRQAALLFIKET